MKGILADLLLYAIIGMGSVGILIVLLGELIGAPLELSPGEWAVALLAGASLPLPGYFLALFHHCRWKREKERSQS